MLQAGTYRVKYNWTDPSGQTVASPESAPFIVAAGNIPQVSLPKLPKGATGANLYLTQPGGAPNSEFLYAATAVGATTLNLVIPQAVNTGLNGNPTPYVLNSTIGKVTTASPVTTDISQTTRILLAVHDSSDVDVVWAALVQRTNAGSQFVGIFAAVVSLASTAGVLNSDDWSSWGIPSDGDGAIDPSGDSFVHGAIVADQEAGSVVGAGPVLYIAGGGEAGDNHEGKLFRGIGPNEWEGLAGDQESPIDGDFGKPHADSRALVFAGDGLLVGTDGGIYGMTNPRLDTELAEHGDDPPQWSSLNGDLSITEFFSVDYDSVNDVIIGGSQDNGTDIQLSDGSQGWVQIDGGDGGDVQFENVGSNAFAFYASDGITNFMRAGDDVDSLDFPDNSAGGQYLGNVEQGNIPFVIPFAVDSIDSSTDIDQQRLILALNSNLYESLDGGDSVTLLGPYAAGMRRDGTGLPGTALVYGGQSGGVGNPNLILSGAGTNLYLRVQANTPLTRVQSYQGSAIRSIVADRDNWKSVYVLDSNANVWWTPDVTSNAQPFQKLTYDLQGLTSDPRVLTQVLAQDGRKILLVGGGSAPLDSLGQPIPGAASGGVYQLLAPDPTDGQPHWRKLGLNLPNALVDDIRYNFTDDVLIIGTFGRGAFTIHHIGSLIGQPGILTVTGDPTLSATDNIAIYLDPLNPLMVDVSQNGLAPSQVVPLSSLSQIQVKGGGGADTLTLDFRNGDMNIPGGITFDGSNALNMAGATLVVIAHDGTTSIAKYDPMKGGNGNLPVDGVPIHFLNLTPVLLSNAAEFNLTTPLSGNIITLDSPGPGQLRLSGAALATCSRAPRYPRPRT